MRDRSRKVVVITGASGGLGREAAVRFASRGYCTVLGARRRESLEETARLCREAGGEALVHVTDVVVEEQVASLASAAVRQWGGIDVWVNNAGVTLVANLEDGPFDEHRRVIETNLYGSIFGARAALPIFRRQKKGVLINVGSVLSEVGQPAVPSYVISKFAVRGLSEALRTAVADEPDIHVCSLLPYAIDTQHFQVAGNELGVKVYAMPPVQSPEKVARAMVKLAEHPQRELHVPGIVVFGLALHWLLPDTTERLILHAVRRWHLSPLPQPRTQGNLYHGSAEDGAVHGDRPPRVSTPLFAVWAVAELVRMQTQASIGWARHVWAHAPQLLR